MIQLTFVYILYSLYIVCMYKKYAKLFQLASCIVFNSLYIICMYKKHTKAILVSQLYRYCILCTLFVGTENIHFKFQAIFSLNCVQILYNLYIFSIYVGIWCTFFVYSLSYKILISTIFVYKIYTNLVFCIIFVYILYSFGFKVFW